jgi:hypothetical protein
MEEEVVRSYNRLKTGWLSLETELIGKEVKG